MNIKFEATCDILDGEYASIVDYLNKQLKASLKYDSPIHNIDVQSAEVIPDPAPVEPQCPKCGSQDTCIIVAGSADNIVWHCMDCKTDFKIRS